MNPKSSPSSPPKMEGKTPPKPVVVNVGGDGEGTKKPEKGGGGSAAPPKTAADLEHLKMLLLYTLSVEKLLDMLYLFCVTALAVNWQPLLYWIQDNLLPLECFTAVTCVLSHAFRDAPGLRRKAKWFIIWKIVHLLYLTGLFFLLAVHLPLLMNGHILPFSVQFGVATAALTYLLFCRNCLEYPINTKNCSIWLLALIMPTVTFLSSQVLYFFGGGKNCYTPGYAHFLINILFGIYIALMLTMINLTMYKTFVNSAADMNKMAAGGGDSRRACVKNVILTSLKLNC